MQKEKDSADNTFGPVGQRFIFNGASAQPMFRMESDVRLPSLTRGQMLVKVRAATICTSDIHTVSGTRIEPTPW